MTLNELMNKILEILPNAQVENDNYGQIVIYTDLKQFDQSPDPILVEMTDEDFE